MVTSVSRNHRCLDGSPAIDIAFSSAVELSCVLAAQFAMELLMSAGRGGGIWIARKAFHQIPQIVEPGQGLLGDPAWNAEHGSGDTAGNAGQRIGVAADGHGIANGVLEISGLQRTDDGWRYCPPAGDIKCVP